MNSRSWSRIAMLVTWLLSVNLLTLACQTGEGQAGAQAVSDEYLQAVSRADFAAGAALFHYPETEQGTSLDDDRAYVTAAIAVLESCIGRPTHPKLGYNGIAMEIGAGGGTLAHWREHAAPTTILYTVDFGDESGRLAFDMIRGDDGAWGIRQVKYGLPIAKSDTMSRIQACAAKLASIK